MENDLITDVACPACSSANIKRIGDINPAFVFASHQLSEKLDGGSLYQCNHCALGFRFPTPPPKVLERLYRTSSIEHWQYEPDSRVDWQRSRNWLEKQAGRSILDIGCYDGAFLHYLGNSWQAHGIELNEQAIQRAKERGIDILAPDLYDLASIEQQFDAVVAFDVIEHVQNPADLLERMSAVTRSGGTIILATGNFDALSWKIMGSAYWYCTIPEHLVFIGKQWCERIAPRFNLELVHTFTYSHEQHRTLKLSAHELGSNMLYRFAPRLFAALRRMGIGDKDTARHEELAHFPPTWTTAKDHLIAIFKKG